MMETVEETEGVGRRGGELLRRAVCLLPFLFGMAVVGCIRSRYYTRSNEIELYFLQSVELGAMIGMGFVALADSVAHCRGVRFAWRVLLGWLLFLPAICLGEGLTLGITRGSRYFLGWHITIWMFYPAWCCLLVLADELMKGGWRMSSMLVGSILFCIPMPFAPFLLYFVGYCNDLSDYVGLNVYWFAVAPYAYMVLVPFLSGVLLRRFPSLTNTRRWSRLVVIALPALLILYPLVTSIARSQRRYPGCRWGTFGSAEYSAFSTSQRQEWSQYPFSKRLLMILEAGGNVFAAKQRYGR